MRLERENGAPIDDPSPSELGVVVRSMRSTGPTSAAVLIGDDGSYLQFAGGPQLFLLERRMADGRHLRAFQEEPVAPYQDGTALHCSAGRIALRRDEWFKAAQLVDTLAEYVQSGGVPAFVQWRAVVG